MVTDFQDRMVAGQEMPFTGHQGHPGFAPNLMAVIKEATKPWERRNRLGATRRHERHGEV